MIGGGACPECGWSSPGPEVCPRCGLPVAFAQAPVGPPLGERLGEGLQVARAQVGSWAEAGWGRLAALRQHLPRVRTVLGLVVLLGLGALAWHRGPGAWRWVRPRLAEVWEGAQARYQEWRRAPPQIEAGDEPPGGEAITFTVAVPEGVTTTRAKIRLVPRGGEAETREFERLGNGRYRVRLPVPRDPARPVAVGVGFQGGKTRKYRWRCDPGELAEALELDVTAARAGDGCWDELRD